MNTNHLMIERLCLLQMHWIDEGRKKMDEKAAEKIRAFKRSAWISTESAQVYCNDVEKLSAGTVRAREIVSRFANGIILDVGSGTGRISKYMKSKGKNVFSLDISRAMLASQKDYLPCTCSDMENLPFRADTFDTVTGVWVLTHFPNWRVIMKELIRVLKEGGRLVFDVACKEHLDWAKKYSSNLEQKYSTPGSFMAFVSVEELSLFLKDNGMQLEAVFPFDHLSSGNELLQILLKKSVVTQRDLDALLALPEVIQFWCQIEEQVLSDLPPGLSFDNLVVAVKSREYPARDYSKEVLSSAEEAFEKIVYILEDQQEQFFPFFIESLCVSTIANFYKKLTEISHGVIDIDIASIVGRLNKDFLTPELKTKLEILLKLELACFAEKFVTSWHKQQDVGYLCGIPLGPIAEYDLLQQFMNSTPERITGKRES
jgi:ubiquinone/menaquinone biosynthesis C-methylase UbiE